MKIKFIDHIVIIVKDIQETKKFYSSFLGQPTHQDGETVVYEISDTKVFFVLPRGEFEKTDKDKSGLNHIAFGVRTLEELKSFETGLNEASIQHSNIKIDNYGNKEYIWFDDPSGIRVEIYCRPL
jgi:catechol 2,3-dioxygenase-like lactoylglutathione lyase family enzyme